MRKREIKIELALESHPHHVLEIGTYSDVPAIGDFVTREDGGWNGYVKRRRWDISASGEIVVRIWLH